MGEMFLNIFRIGTAIESEISIIIREITFREGDRLVACGKGDGGWLVRGGWKMAAILITVTRRLAPQTSTLKIFRITHSLC